MLVLGRKVNEPVYVGNMLRLTPQSISIDSIVLDVEHPCGCPVWMTEKGMPEGCLCDDSPIVTTQVTRGWLQSFGVGADITVSVCRIKDRKLWLGFECWHRVIRGELLDQAQKEVLRQIFKSV